MREEKWCCLLDYGSVYNKIKTQFRLYLNIGSLCLSFKFCVARCHTGHVISTSSVITSSRGAIYPLKCVLLISISTKASFHCTRGAVTFVRVQVLDIKFDRLYDVRHGSRLCATSNRGVPHREPLFPLLLYQTLLCSRIFGEALSLAHSFRFVSSWKHSS
jgi:hypothetical protein